MTVKRSLDKISVSDLGAPGGVCPLGADGKVPQKHLSPATAPGVALDQNGYIPARNIRQGVGSGLDADLLGGKRPSEFAAATTTIATNYPLQGGGTLRNGRIVIGIAEDVLNGQMDHGALAGLSDDDHTLYARADGTRAFTGVPSCAVAPTTGAHLVNKTYADGLVAAGGDVTGPASSVANRIAIFSGTTGKSIGDSGVLVSDLAVAAKGVTNGDSHDHSGGDGAQIAYSSLSGTPTIPAASSTTPAALGVAAAGVGATFSRADHVHAMPTTADVGAFGLSVTPEVSITGATTLTSAAFGKMHVCTGTAADYPLGLPAAAGNAGKLLGIRIDKSCTKLVTLDGNASELIDGATTRVMWAGESALLLCDGTGWTKIAGASVPMICKMTANAGQSIISGASTTVRFDVKDIDNATIGSLSTNNIIIKRAGFYLIIAHGSINTNDWQLNIIGSVSSLSRVADISIIPAVVLQKYLASGNNLSSSILQSSGSTATTQSYPYPYLSAQEVVQW